MCDDVRLVACADDTVLLGKAEDVTTAITTIQTEAAKGGLRLRKAKTQLSSPTPQSIQDVPFLV